ncbi:hypothetical protein GU927_002495 [Rhodobacteraceae bacterium HSP-20]|uniref:Uncharacterized protein n=1 Tax=Paragemmobacter amnigenus TaxID=2852097 RepID=A0ABS6IZW9_9RHOB|nr:hypothetical protein [Rhodobacter amnigenus]MBU9696707.1 hypothetical protein [Rhodobacter amnigenus]MBV4387934.1 hypothetical protein [Rhodobacter amnigenus]
MKQEAENTSYSDALNLKAAIEELLGADEWYRLKDTRSVAKWKASFLRVMNSSEVAIRATIKITDCDQLESLRSIIDQGRHDVRKSASLIDAFSAFSATFLRLSFQQLGHMPNRKGRRTSTRAIPAHWKLDTYRSVQYVQSDMQALWVEYRKDERDISEKASDPKFRKLHRTG